MKPRYPGMAPGSFGVRRIRRRRTMLRGLLSALAVVVAILSATAGWAQRADAANPAFISWSNLDTGRIARAIVDGTGVNQGLIGGLKQPIGVAVDSQYVSWTDHVDNTIGRADLGGRNPNRRLIAACTDQRGSPSTPSTSTGR